MVGVFTQRWMDFISTLTVDRVTSLDCQSSRMPPDCLYGGKMALLSKGKYATSLSSFEPTMSVSKRISICGWCVFVNSRTESMKVAFNILWKFQEMILIILVKGWSDMYTECILICWIIRSDTFLSRFQVTLEDCCTFTGA